MKQVFTIRRLALTSLGSLGVLMLSGLGAAHAVPVRGRVLTGPVEVRKELLGFTRTRVANPSEVVEARSRDAAILLKVKESLPLTKPTTPSKLVAKGLRLEPDIATCVVDSKVEIVNAEAKPLSVMVGEQELRVDPGATRVFECTVGQPERAVRVKEWPHVRATIYVGEVGVAGSLDDDGGFVLEAPKGTYELLIMGWDGVLDTRAVEVKGAALSLGVIDLRPKASKSEGP